MPTISLIKCVDNILKPDSGVDSDVLDAWKVGELLRARVSKMRNPRFHRRGMAFLRLVLEHQEKYKNLDDLLVEFKIRSGHYQEYITAKGEIVYIPKSISFHEMDESEFRALYSKWVDIALQEFLPRWKANDIDRVLDELHGFL